LLKEILVKDFFYTPEKKIDMFGKKNPSASEDSSSYTTPASTSINSLVIGTNIEGTIHATSDIRIDGNINGTLHCSGRVIIGEDGKVEGDIQCENAVIEGTFTGTLTVASTLNVKETAVIRGDVNTQKLHVQNGAVFNVNCNTGGSKIKSISEDIPAADMASGI